MCISGTITKFIPIKRGKYNSENSKLYNRWGGKFFTRSRQRLCVYRIDDHKLYQLNASNISQPAVDVFVGATDVISSSPAVANGYVYVGDSNGNLYQLNAFAVSQKIANFRLVMHMSLLHHLQSPTVYVYIGGSDGNVYQLNATNIFE